MENNTNQKPVFNGLLESSVYEGKLVKVVFQPAKQAGWPNSYRLLFLIEGLMINGVEHIYFVNTWVNDIYRSGSKTARYLQALGVTELKGMVTMQDLESLKGRKVKMYLEPGKEYFSAKLQRNVQNMEIMSMNAINRTVPNLVQQTTQKPFIMQQPAQTPVQQPQPVVAQAPVQVKQAVQQVKQPVVKPVQQTSNRVVQNGTWNSNGTPMSVSNAASLVSKPAVVAAPQTNTKSYSATPVTNVVEQPLPQETFVPEELEF